MFQHLVVLTGLPAVHMKGLDFVLTLSRIVLRPTDDSDRAVFFVALRRTTSGLEPPQMTKSACWKSRRVVFAA